MSTKGKKALLLLEIELHLHLVGNLSSPVAMLRLQQEKYRSRKIKTFSRLPRKPDPANHLKE